MFHASNSWSGGWGSGSDGSRRYRSRAYCGTLRGSALRRQRGNAGGAGYGVEGRAPDGFPAERGERTGRWAAWSAAAGPARVRPAFAVRISFCPFAPAKRECGRCGIRCGRGVRRMGFPPKGASAPGDGRHGARRRGLRAFALRLPCGFRFARLRRQRGNAGGAGYGVGEACAGWVSRRKGRARRAMGGMERGGGACARSPCVCRADFVLPVCAGKEGMRAVQDTVWEMLAQDGFPVERGACAPGDGRHGARRRGLRALLHAAVKQAARIGEIRRRPRLERGEDTVAQGGRFHRKGQRIVFQAAKLVQPVAHIDRQRVVQP